MTKLHFAFLIIFLGISIIACDKKQKKNLDEMMIVKGSVEGLRKGTLYLQKVLDTIVVDIDSTVINGSPNFEFMVPIESAEIFYLYLNKEDGDSLNDRILFFGEKGTIEINTLLKTFESSAKIIGSKNQELLQEYQSFNRKFNSQNLDLMKDFYQAQIDNNQERIDSVNQQLENLVRRKYLYSLNFSITNSEYEISPYIAVSQIPDANWELF